MAAPTISVVIPCHNRASELRRALGSVAAQSQQPLEVIVCDDGSEEDLGAVVAEFSHRLSVTCMRIEQSGGPAKPRNVAVARARGEWIALLDSDDAWDAEKLATVAAALGPEDIYYHPLRTRGPGPGRAHHRRVIGARSLPRTGAAFDLLTLGNPIPTSSVVMRRSVYLGLNGMDTSAEFEDFDFWIRAAVAGSRFCRINRALGSYYVAAASRSSRYREQVAFLERLFGRYGAEFSGSQRMNVEAYKQYCIAIQCTRAGDRVEAAVRLRAARGLRTLRQRFVRRIRLATVALFPLR